MEHEISTELQTAWDSAYSVRPGDNPQGDYIGDVRKGNTVYHFYKNREKGEYTYTSETIK